MLTIAYYFLQVILCSGMMMGYYWLVLRNKRFHQYNRFYLLAIALLSWIVPLLKISWSYPVVSSGQPQVMQFLSVLADSNTQIEQTIGKKGFEWSWNLLATGIYFCVAAILLFGLLRAFARLHYLLKNHSCKNVGDVFLILTQAQGTPFSFFRYIFWNEEIDIRSEAGKQILQHELTHVKQKHSFDKLFIQVMLIGGWFNPFFWLLKKEMEMIHEFIADKKAINNGDTASLAHMLLTAAYPQQQFALTNPFFFSPIRRRLKMLANNQNPRFSYIRRLVVLPLLALVVVLFAFRNKEQRKDITISVASVMENVMENSKDLLLAVPKENIPGSSQADTITIQADTVYIKGKDNADVVKIVPVIVKNNAFDKALIILDGKKVANSVLETLDPNLIACVNILKGKSATAIYGEEGKNGIVLVSTKGLNNNKPLMILDGKKADSNLLQTLNPNRIQSVHVLKDSSAAALYGEAGKNGVVIIDTKGNKGNITVTDTAADVPGSRPYREVTGINIAGIKRPDSLILVNGYPANRSKYKQVTGVKIAPPVVVEGFRIEPKTNEVTVMGYATGAYPGSAEFVKRNPDVKHIYLIESQTQLLIELKDGTKETYDLTKPESKKRAETKYGRLPVAPGKPASSEPSYEVKDITLSPITPASFPGGIGAWQKYLMRNLDGQIVKKNGGPPGKYTVVVRFMVDKTGNVSNVAAENDPGYGTKNEAMRIIVKGPKWVPAKDDNGNAVNSSQKQAVTFFVIEDK